MGVTQQCGIGQLTAVGVTQQCGIAEPRPLDVPKAIAMTSRFL